MPISPKRQSGFTIIELLIVIVIIAILAAITLVAYNSMQARARDSARLQDVQSIKQALSMYFSEYNSFPTNVPNPGQSTWEISTDPGFLSSLNGYNGSHVFKDPLNIGGDTPEDGTTVTSRYMYHTFNAGTYGCPASLGPFYVLWVTDMETQSSGQLTTNGCSSQTLFTTARSSTPRYYIYFGFQ